MLVHTKSPQVHFSFSVWCVEFMSKILCNFLNELEFIKRQFANNYRGSSYQLVSTIFNEYTQIPHSMGFEDSGEGNDPLDR